MTNPVGEELGPQVHGEKLGPQVGGERCKALKWGAGAVWVVQGLLRLQGAAGSQHLPSTPREG